MLPPSAYAPWQQDDARAIFSFFNGRSSPRGTFKDYHAASMVEQADAESSFYKDVWGDLYTAYGLWQLHDDRLTRVCNFLRVPKPICTGKFSAKHGLTLAQQCEAAWHEFQTTESVAFALILSASNAQEAGAIACRSYERAGAKGQPQIRGARTILWLDWLRHNPPAHALAAEAA